MNYARLYDKIIVNAKAYARSKKSQYLERHHIIPKCMGGADTPDNLVLLTPKEHFICHHLLTKIHTNNKLKYAFWAMCNQLSGDVDRKYKITSSTYQTAKLNFQKANSILHSGKTLSADHIAICSQLLRENNPHKPGKDSHLYGIARSDDVKHKISLTKLNNPERNSQFKGYFITPHGKFASANQVAKLLGISSDVVRKRCCHSDKTISKFQVSCSKDLAITDIGKTFKELGWDFEPVLPVSAQPPIEL